MLPPLIPLSAAPVTSQLDPVKPNPDIPPVTPIQKSSSETNIDMGERDREQAEVLLRKEQRRHQRRRSDRRVVDRHPDLEEGPAIPGDFLNADDTVPVVPIIDDEPRQGLWVDLKV
ncbi:aspartate-semialdehyde dehydrogenase [Pseudomonas sp. NPDC078416]|jgi:hypothetical protein|uniref:aspartate-semialdehyde dehydrogenase n=1 Tax=Pseudomonas TaxID=286 RepID=UPI000F040BEB|nr:aspartate-semialdehyde dehydrogenase [Pseudomonas graminis]MDC6379952.1 aspartate-semialdehyde dehydrogenase [Pseudomonas graminis]